MLFCFTKLYPPPPTGSLRSDRKFTNVTNRREERMLLIPGGGDSRKLPMLTKLLLPRSSTNGARLLSVGSTQPPR